MVNETVGFLFCTRCGAKRPVSQIACPSCGALRRSSALPVAAKKTPSLDLHPWASEEPNDLREVVSELRSLSERERLLVRDVMVFAAQARSATWPRHSDIRLIYGGLILIRLPAADRIKTLKCCSARGSKNQHFLRFMMRTARLWLMAQLLELREGARSSRRGFRSDYADHIGIERSAIETFLARLRQVSTNSWLGAGTALLEVLFTAKKKALSPPLERSERA